jgi:pimeloyl-ACP methyl ester carboxylesterase
MDGPYINDMVRAFGEQGIALTPVDTKKWSGGTILDATLSADLFRTGKQPIQVLLDDFKQSGTQFNLTGYSYGSLAALQVAINYAQTGTRVDNLVLIGSPISQHFLNELRNTPNIKNVVVVDLTAQGDPIKAGMSRMDLMIATPTLGYQMNQSSGHFYYAPDTAIGQARRNDLAAT